MQHGRFRTRHTRCPVRGLTCVPVQISFLSGTDTTGSVTESGLADHRRAEQACPGTGGRRPSLVRGDLDDGSSPYLRISSQGLRVGPGMAAQPGAGGQAEGGDYRTGVATGSEAVNNWIGRGSASSRSLHGPDGLTGAHLDISLRRRSHSYGRTGSRNKIRITKCPRFGGESRGEAHRPGHDPACPSQEKGVSLL